VLGNGPLAYIYFSAEPVVEHRSSLKADSCLTQQLGSELLARGVLTNLTAKMYLSLAHTDRDIDCIVQATMPQVAAAASENTARIFGFYPRNEVIKPGADAEWTVRARGLHSRAGYSCFEGWRVRGRITMSFLRGRPLVEDGRLSRTPSYRHFLPRHAIETR
jgi:hypothetical protein